jgi:hypothetical protein
LEQQINITFYVRICKSVIETSALLTLAYGNYAMKKFLNCIGGSKKGEKMCRMTKEVGSQKCKRQMQVQT